VNKHAISTANSIVTMLTCYIRKVHRTTTIAKV